MKLEDMNVLVKATCYDCEKQDSLEVNLLDWSSYIDEKLLVQKVWPDLSTWDREIIIGHRTGFYQCALCNALEIQDAETAEWEHAQVEGK